MIRYWLGRASFSFLIVATFLVWEGYQISQGRLVPNKSWQMVLCYIGAALCFALFLVGAHERHRGQ